MSENWDALRPWEQRDNEPDHCYRAFKHFRDQNLDNPNTDRTLLGATRRYYENPNLKKAHDNILRWSKEYNWHERARAWDRYLQRRVDEAAAEGRADVARERSATVADVESRAIEFNLELTEKLIKKLSDPETFEQFMPKDITAASRSVTEFLKAIARIRSTSKDPEHEQPLTDKEREKIDEAWEEIMKKYNSEEKPEDDSEQPLL